MAQNELIFDAWTPISFKRTLGDKRTVQSSWLAPTWVGDHGRRLTAYKVLQAYVDNAAREFLTADQDVKDAHREYGDANLIVQTILAALLGEDQQIVVPGAELWDEKENKPTSESADPTEIKAKWELQTWLREQATAERFGLKMLENERNAVALGDGVYTLGVNNKKERVRLRVFDPGFYFPVLDDGNEDEFPDRVHIAWEFELEPGQDPSKRRVRRITWELVTIDEVRSYEWNEEATNITCLMSDGTWELDLGGRQTIDDFTEATVKWATFLDKDGNEVKFKDIDLHIDFMPVLHLPNTVALLNHYGRSSLSTILQILDDISNADTDLNAASRTTGTPPIVLKGSTLGKATPTYGAGKVWEVSADGGLDVLDTSRALDALLKYIEALLNRMSVNSRVPESVLGRVEVTGNLAGITLALSFGPLAALVKEMRLVRDEKYPLLLKFWWRMARSAGWEGVPDQWFDAAVEFGAFLPQDESAAVETVTRLLTADPPAISLETAVRILMIAGLPIDDAIEEVGRIEGRDFKGAQDLLDATGDEDAVFDYLNRDKPPEPLRPPAPVVPPTGVPVTEVPPQ